MPELNNYTNFFLEFVNLVLPEYYSHANITTITKEKVYVNIMHKCFEMPYGTLKIENEVYN